MSDEYGGQDHPHTNYSGNRFNRTWLPNIIQYIEDDIHYAAGKMCPHTLLPE
jgi:hypothetical protein